MRTAVFDQLLIVGLLLASGAFALAVWLGPRAVAPSSLASTRADSSSQSVAALNVPRGTVLHPLALPQKLEGVDLGAMPDRLANEAAPAAWQRVITVRGVPGVASITGPSVIAWTEAGIAYWLTSPTRTTDELIQIANELR